MQMPSLRLSWRCINRIALVPALLCISSCVPVQPKSRGVRQNRRLLQHHFKIPSARRPKILVFKLQGLWAHRRFVRPLSFGFECDTPKRSKLKSFSTLCCLSRTWILGAVNLFACQRSLQPPIGLQPSLQCSHGSQLPCHVL